MRNKFVKMTFMALCLSTSSALHAMNDEDGTCSSSAITSCVGKYEIRRNDSHEQTSGSVAIRQEGDHLVLENFSLIHGSFYYNRMQEIVSESEVENTNFTSPFNAENRQIANFVLSAFPTEVIQLKFLGNPERSMQYGAEVSFGGAERAPMHVRFRTEKDSYFGEMFHLSVESPYGLGTRDGTVFSAPLEQFRLFKVGSAEHERLLRPLFAAASSSSSTSSLTASSSSSTSTPAVPVLELDTREFHMGKRNDYPTTGFSAFEGSHRWTLGEKASITLPLAEMASRPSSISFLNTRGLVTASHSQKLTVKMNGNIVKSYDYALGNNNQTIEVPLPKDGDSATIEFETPHAISPLNLGTSADKRELGILFREVQLHY